MPSVRELTMEELDEYAKFFRSDCAGGQRTGEKVARCLIGTSCSTVAIRGCDIQLLPPLGSGWLRTLHIAKSLKQSYLAWSNHGLDAGAFSLAGELGDLNEWIPNMMAPVTKRLSAMLKLGQCSSCSKVESNLEPQTSIQSGSRFATTGPNDRRGCQKCLP